MKVRHTEYSRNTVLRREDGGVAVFFVILLPVLMLLAGYSMEVSRHSATEQHAGRIADNIALSAISAYFDTVCVNAQTRDQCVSARLSAALARADAVAQSSKLVGEGLTAALSLRQERGKAILEAGRWDGRSFTPYGEGTEPNALRVSGELFTGGTKTNPFFAAFTGIRSRALTVDSVAYYVPVDSVLMMDLSHSLAQDNFNSGNPFSPDPTEPFSFYYGGCREIREGKGTCDWLNSMITHMSGQPWLNHIHMRRAADGEYYPFNPDTRSVRPADDFNCVNNTYRDDIGQQAHIEDLDYEAKVCVPGYGGPETKAVCSQYHPDPGRFPAPPIKNKYFVPRVGTECKIEPMTSLYKGWREFLQRTSARQHPDDRVSFVAYNSEFRWPAITKMLSSKDFWYLDRLASLDTLTPNTYNIDIASYAHGFVPRKTMNDWSINRAPDIHGSDTYRALRIAVENLTEDSKPYENRHIYLTTDGFWNCLDNGTCGLAEEYVRGAYALVDSLVPTLRSENIALNVTLYGRHSGNGYFLFRKDENMPECHTDESARASGRTLDFIRRQTHRDTLGTWEYLPLDAGDVFSREIPSSLHNLTVRTQGRMTFVLPAPDDCSEDPYPSDCSSLRMDEAIHVTKSCRSYLDQANDAWQDSTKRQYVLVKAS